MSKTSKARRDAKKKKKNKLGSRRSTAAPVTEPQVVAQLLLDGSPYAAIATDGREWNLLMQDGLGAGASDPGSIWGIIQSLASKAEANGNFVSLQSHSGFRTLMEENKLEPISEDFDDMADRVLTIYPFPAPALEYQAAQVAE